MARTVTVTAVRAMSGPVVKVHRVPVWEARQVDPWVVVIGLGYLLLGWVAFGR